ncbi:acyltransferase [Vitreoscilla massiliensis]|uniref:Acyltransferase n=1 Tax=Vitreoscilla massiliensis TaxID=1689272 RepID=A0ABY4E3D9_9NEIS|nr:acyltransferase family protein [Vitreoscilla massiliensis]UOO87927.1 acyltransferase [Vitreoscilla massiliensis]
MKFRYDINALRALAVVLVTLYHFKVPGFAGGFIGVDVFFVISGFLMTNIICKHSAAQPFHLVTFYMARVSRIIPALLGLILALAVMGYFVLIPEYYQKFAHNALASLAFFSNYQYAAESAGYFDLAAEENILLHTWSLSVEWLFYLLYPIVLYPFLRKKYHIKVVLWLMFVLSLCYASYLLHTNAKGAFYFLSSRIWEMVLGGLVAIYPMSLTVWRSRLLATMGWLCLLAAVWFYGVATPWPAYYALLPTLGTACIIAANTDYKCLKWVWIQYLGKYSYSIYLWHWPVAFYGFYFVSVTEHIPYFKVWAIGSSLLLGALSYYGIERPSAKWAKQHTQPHVFAGIAVAMLTLIAGLQYVQQAQGFPQRIAAQTRQNFDYVVNSDPKRKQCHFASGVDVKFCQYGKGKQLKAIVWGDSHANAVVNAVATASEKNDGHILSWTSSSCPTVLGIQSQADSKFNCNRQLQRFFLEVQSYPKETPIIVVNRLNAYLHGNNETQNGQPQTFVYTPYSLRNLQKFQGEIIQGYEQAICQLSQTHPVYVMQPIPEMGKNVLNEELKYSMILHQGLQMTVSKHQHLQRSNLALITNAQLAQRCGVKLLDPLPYLCDQKQCYGSRNNVPYYFDDDHLSLRGARRLAPLFEPLLK